MVRDGRPAPPVPLGAAVITTGARFWFAVAALALVADVAYLLFSGAEGFGVLVLLGLFIAACVLGVLTVVTRDGDVPATASGSAATAVAVLPLASAWPAMAALGLGVTAAGAAVGGALLYVGFALLGVTLAEWMVQGWAERATADPAYNAALRNRIMFPIEVPVLGLLGTVVVLLGFSRVLLALPKAGSTVVAIVVAALVLGLATLVATRPRISASLVAGIAVVGAIALLVGGVVGALAGEREIEHHEETGVGAEGAEQTITFTAAGSEPAELDVPVGEPVRIRFVNNDAPGQSHSLTIQGVDGESSTGDVGSGEEHVIEITAPEAGDYTFVIGPSPDEATSGRLVAVDSAGAEGSGSTTTTTSAP